MLQWVSDDDTQKEWAQSLETERPRKCAASRALLQAPSADFFCPCDVGAVPSGHRSSMRAADRAGRAGQGRAGHSGVDGHGQGEAGWAGLG